MNTKYVVGLGEALWDVLPEGKKLGGAPANFAFHAGQFGLNSIAVSALVLDIQTWITEHTTDKYQFLVVDLKHIAALHALAYYLLGVEVLTKVDVENLHTVLRS